MPMLISEARQLSDDGLLLAFLNDSGSRAVTARVIRERMSRGFRMTLVPVRHRSVQSIADDEAIIFSGLDTKDRQRLRGVREQYLKARRRNKSLPWFSHWKSNDADVRHELESYLEFFDAWSEGWKPFEGWTKVQLKTWIQDLVWR